MLASLTRLLRRVPRVASDSRLLDDWAHQHGDSIKRVRNSQGGVVSFSCHGRPARLEWGPSQRSYISGRELRLRVELDLPPALEMLVMSRALAEHLEALAFEQLTRGQQTEIDATMPEEARWLSMFTPVALTGGEGFSKHFVVLAGSAARAQRWVHGELATRLSRAGDRWLSADAPFVLMTLRGRLYLRTAATRLDAELLDGVRQIAEIASLQVLRLANRATPGVAAASAASATRVTGAAGPDPLGHAVPASHGAAVGQIAQGVAAQGELTSLMSDFDALMEIHPSDSQSLPFEPDFDLSAPHDAKPLTLTSKR